MRFFAFLLSSSVTVALIYLLNIPLPIGGTKTPALGSFLSPQHGFWQNAEPWETNWNADLKLPGLKGKVDVFFDERLVPHVYAEHDVDAYFVQGYLHAKFRLWQMEFQTHAAGGRLSEIMGDSAGTTNFLQVDKFFRRLGMVYGAEQSLKKMEADPFTKSVLDAYTAGANAYIGALAPHEYPLEYKLLNYQPEPWTNMKTALFMKYIAFDLAGGEWDFEMTNARQIFSAEDFDLLYPVSPDSLVPIVPKGTAFAKPAVLLTSPAGVDSTYQIRNGIDQSASRPDKDNGSNNWAVAGLKTASGRPMLCNDPHLGLNLPSIWYEMQLSTPSFNSYGVTFPGAPSVIIGFNDSCAWGVTNAGRDVRDYYEIQFRDSSMEEYMFNGQWKKTTFRNEVIKVKGKPGVVEKIAMTEFGPVMYDRKFGNKLQDDKYYAVRWKAHDASNELLTFVRMNQVSNHAEFRSIIRDFQVPAQNFVFASKNGDIGIIQHGQMPAKWHRQGDFVMPGADTSYRWQGFIPVSENPFQFNPERGFVSSANQLPADPTYPYYIGGSFALYRGIMLNRSLSQMSNITPADMQHLQTNNYNVFAETARPILLKYINSSGLDEDEKLMLTKLENWNLYNDVEAEGATIFKVWWDSLEVAVWGDEFMQTSLPLRWPDESTLVEALLRDSTFKFVNDIRTQQLENISAVVSSAFRKAYPALKEASTKGSLAWGKYKDTGIKHLLRLPAFSRLHLPIGGGEHILNATKQGHGPSWRMVVHLTDEVEAYGIYPGGQSGNPGSRYYDTFISGWAKGRYYSLLFLTKEQAAQNPRIKWKLTFSKA